MPTVLVETALAAPAAEIGLLLAELPEDCSPSRSIESSTHASPSEPEQSWSHCGKGYV